jgi:mitochondrial fission protein ELM1
MRSRGITRPYAGAIENWTYPPFDETARVAEAVRRLVGLNSETL